ncbi:hypothetical protein TRFO_02528 [Tritrichomonas foetus]|uniref:VWFA domain-containing protein n=1 Tax=Tritrichomonas foetus TaxID=1144522 RepID=A0A1J4L226_9EUKA|nr:hypothetical protein TRFO_02528 [Tritrichomonas foetus]|eukprot:OHT17499.1 hypothetical protein TRFO_02528 [Tritrichomonas foetus]
MSLETFLYTTPIKISFRITLLPNAANSSNDTFHIKEVVNFIEKTLATIEQTEKSRSCDIELVFNFSKPQYISLENSLNTKYPGGFMISIADLFLKSFDLETPYQIREVSDSELIKYSIPDKSKDIKDHFIFELKPEIKYQVSKDKFLSIYLKDFVDTTSHYDVSVVRKDWDLRKRLFFRIPWTQLRVYTSEKNGKLLYSSKIIINSLCFKLDTFGIPSCALINENSTKGEIKEPTFQLYDLSGKTEVKLDQSYLTYEKKDTSKNTFIQLLAMGVRIRPIIAIDFSSSNRPVLIPNLDGLHSGNLNMNLYVAAMKSIYDTLSIYDPDNSVSLYGLCAKIEGVFNEYFPMKSKVLQIINTDQNTTLINDKKAIPTNRQNTGQKSNPKSGQIKRSETDESDSNRYYSKESMIQAYNVYRQMVQFWDPTKLSNFLKKLSEKAKLEQEKNNNIYTVLIIITDGLVVDFHDIVDAIIEINDDPMFIVFVGVGEEKSDRNFQGLQKIDDNLNILKNSDNNKEYHDIVTTVHFKTSDIAAPEKFCEAAFKEIPGAIARFMNTNRKPKSDLE